MAIPEDSAYSALKSTTYMQNFDTSKCNYAHRNSKSLITCTEDGQLCYCKETCPYKQEYKVEREFIIARNTALNYRTLLQQTEEEKKYKAKRFGNLLEEAPEFLVKQLIRKGTFGDFRNCLEFLSLEIINAYYVWYLVHKEK